MVAISISALARLNDPLSEAETVWRLIRGDFGGKRHRWRQAMAGQRLLSGDVLSQTERLLAGKALEAA